MNIHASSAERYDGASFGGAEDRFVFSDSPGIFRAINISRVTLICACMLLVTQASDKGKNVLYIFYTLCVCVCVTVQRERYWLERVYIYVSRLSFISVTHSLSLSHEDINWEERKSKNTASAFDQVTIIKERERNMCLVLRCNWHVKCAAAENFNGSIAYIMICMHVLPSLSVVTHYQWFLCCCFIIFKCIQYSECMLQSLKKRTRSIAVLLLWVSLIYHYYYHFFYVFEKLDGLYGIKFSLLIFWCR